MAGRGGFMRRFLTLVCLLFLALPAGISISGCYRNPAGNYCSGGYGIKGTDVYSITLQPATSGVRSDPSGFCAVSGHMQKHGCQRDQLYLRNQQ